MSRRRSQQPLILIGFGALLIVGAVIFWAMNPVQEPVPVTTITALEGPYPDVPRVRVGDAKAAFELKNVVFVDVRGKSYYEESHIPGSLSLPLNELENRMDELDPDDWIIFYCT